MKLMVVIDFPMPLLDLGHGKRQKIDDNSPSINWLIDIVQYCARCIGSKKSKPPPFLHQSRARSHKKTNPYLQIPLVHSYSWQNDRNNTWNPKEALNSMVSS